MRGAAGSGPARVMLSMPTGAGKTYLAAFMIRNALAKGLRCMFVVDLLCLIEQTRRTLASLGIECEVVQGDRDWDPEAPVLLASAQTLVRRSNVPRADLIFVDEAHTMRDGVLKWIDGHGRRSVAVGLSATPFKMELAESWDAIVGVSGTDRLIRKGVLTPLDVKTSVPLISMTDSEGKELRGTGKGGEWSDRQAETAALGLVGDIPKIHAAETAAKFGGSVPTIAFVPSVRYAGWLRDRFLDGGAKAHAVSHHDRPKDRAAAIESFRSGETEILICVEALAKGFDVPSVRCVIDARPRKKSFEGYVQAIGRGIRCDEGKKDCLLLDFAGNWPRFEVMVRQFYAMGCTVFGQYDAPRAEGGEAGRRGRVAPNARIATAGFRAGWRASARPAG